MPAKAPKRKRSLDYVRLGDVQFASRNPKVHDTDGIAGSISRFGLAAVPVRDDRTGRLVAGHGRIESLRKMKEDGQEPPDGIELDKDGDWVVPVLAGWSSRSDSEAESYLVGDNEWTVRGGWDFRQLAEVLEDIEEVDPALLTHAGFSHERLQEMIDSFDDAAGKAEEATVPDDIAWPALRYVVPQETHDMFTAVMALVGDGDDPDHLRVSRVAALATRALEKGL